jgi:hypothetical protein
MLNNPLVINLADGLDIEKIVYEMFHFQCMVKLAKLVSSRKGNRYPSYDIREKLNAIFLEIGSIQLSEGMMEWIKNLPYMIDEQVFGPICFTVVNYK